MKVAISAVGSSLDAAIDQRFGRAAFLLIVDTETNTLISAINNTENANAASGAGVSAGQSVCNAGAEIVITGNVGPKAFQVLNAAGIKVFTGASGAVKNAIASQAKGSLDLATAGASAGPGGAGRGRGRGGGRGR